MRLMVARARGMVCASLISVLLSGCALVEQIGALGKDEQQASVPIFGDLGAEEAWADTADPAGARKEEEISRGDADVPRPKTKPEIVDPRSLVGLDKEAIEHMFGAPQSVTIAQPATVWAWEQDGCRMRLFFYPDIAAQKMRALTYEISAEQPTKNAMLIETCVSRIKWANAETTR